MKLDPGGVSVNSEKMAQVKMFTAKCTRSTQPCIPSYTYRAYNNTHKLSMYRVLIVLHITESI